MFHAVNSIFFFSDNYAFLGAPGEIYIATLPDVVTASTNLVFTKLIDHGNNHKTEQMGYDPVGQMLYWVQKAGSGTSNTISRCDLNGVGRKDLALVG